jgi:flavin reductase (DIM6/NTAB) family NADH-FMN oxidoreductase RutF
MAVDSMAFRDALGRFASGVSVIAAPLPGGGAAGVTITSFASVSLDPPLVLFCIGRRSANFDAFVGAPAFSINILAADQEGLSELFASQRDDKFAGVAVTVGEGGVPLLAGCLANLECSRVAVHSGGDHEIVVGRVEALRIGSGEPLLRFRGAYCCLGQDTTLPPAPALEASAK